MSRTSKRGYAAVYTGQICGSGARIITVEADISRGLHSFSIVGLTDKAVSESRDRLAAAIRHSGFTSPKSSARRIVLSLAPASMRKDGAHYDVPLAIAYLQATQQLPLLPHPLFLIGELALDGTIREVRGTLPLVLAAKRAGIPEVYVPVTNASEAALVPGMRIFTPRTLQELTNHVQGTAMLNPFTLTKERACSSTPAVDYTSIRGQETAKRALSIAAAGGHNLVLYGPPGTGKTMLARALPGILPPLTPDALLEVTAIHSIAGTLPDATVLHEPPFRAPHHSISATGMVGGGAQPHAGEVTLAHRGVLFLDELTEFDARTLEALRQPLEDKQVTIVRTQRSLTFPADCMVVATMNPANTLSSDTQQIRSHARNHAKKLSRPIIDRFDMWVSVPEVSPETLAYSQPLTPSVAIQKDVIAACSRAIHPTIRNARLSITTLDEKGMFSDEATALLLTHAGRLHLSPRTYHRTRRVARTIADMEASREVTAAHILEALTYRPHTLFE